MDEDSSSIILASLVAHRNVVFGAKVYVEDQSVSSLCESLLKRALEDCTSVGEQPQALSTLHGLTAYVQNCLNGQEESLSLNTIRDNEKELEAVRAIATGVPRPGHSVVGPGTHRDAGNAWELLAKEFIEKSRSEEALLYQKHGGELVGIELLADTKPDYLESAGGAMARFFFL